MDNDARKALADAFATDTLTQEQAREMFWEISRTAGYATPILLLAEDLIERITVHDDKTVVGEKEDLLLELANDAIFDVAEYDWSDQSGSAYDSAEMRLDDLLEQHGLTREDVLVENKES